MTDQPQTPGHGGNSGAWQPVPGGGDYDPDQTMHVSFAAQLPPEPRPGEDPLGAHGPAGAPDAATTWSIPVIKDDTEGDSGEFAVGAFGSAWDEAPSPAAPTQSFPAGMFGQGAAAVAAAAQARAEAESAARAAHDTGTGWAAFTGPEPVPWQPVDPAAAEAAWSSAVDDPAGDHPRAFGADDARGPHTADAPGGPHDSGRGGAHPADAGEFPGFASGGAQQGGGAYGGSAPGTLRDVTPGGGSAAGPAGPRGFAGGGYGTAPGQPGDGGPDGSRRSVPEPLPEAAPGLAADPARNGLPQAAPDTPPGDGRPHPLPEPEAGFAEGAGPDDDTDLPPEAAGGHGPGGAAHEPEPLPEAVTGAGHDERPTAETDAGHDDAPDTGYGPDAGDEAPAYPEDDGDTDEVAEPEEEPAPVEPTRSEHPVASYVLRVNGADRPVTDAWLGESLLYVLRERLGLAGAKDGCEQGECGACSVQVDGRLVASCLVPAATAAGSEVRTVEGLSVDRRPCDIQQALADCGAVQCGFCIPGMAMTVHDLLEGNHRPTELETRQALSGNLCRCSGYRGVVEAVRQVVAARDGDDPPPAHPRIPAQSGPSSPEAAV